MSFSVFHRVLLWRRKDRIVAVWTLWADRHLGAGSDGVEAALDEEEEPRPGSDPAMMTIGWKPYRFLIEIYELVADELPIKTGRGKQNKWGSTIASYGALLPSQTLCDAWVILSPDTWSFSTSSTGSLSSVCTKRLWLPILASTSVPFVYPIGALHLPLRLGIEWSALILRSWIGQQH